MSVKLVNKTETISLHTGSRKVQRSIISHQKTNLKEIVVIVIAVARHSLQVSHRVLKWLTTKIKEGFFPTNENSLRLKDKKKPLRFQCLLQHTLWGTRGTPRS